MRFRFYRGFGGKAPASAHSPMFREGENCAMKKSKLTRMTALMFAAAVGVSLTGCRDQYQTEYGAPPAFDSQTEPFQAEYGAPEDPDPYTEPQDVYGPPEDFEEPSVEDTTEITTTAEMTTQPAVTETILTDDTCEYDPDKERYQCVYGPPEVMTGTTIAPQTVPQTTAQQTTIQTAPERYQYETLDPFLETSYEPLEHAAQVVTPPADCEDGHCLITRPPEVTQDIDTVIETSEQN